MSLAGGQRPAVRIQADTQALASYGIGMDTLRTAIAAANANSAKGSFDGPTRAYTINANDQLLTADDYKKLIVAYKNGAPVRLVDVAQVVDERRERRASAPGPGERRAAPAIILNVQRQPGANVIATVDAIKKQLPELQAGLPASAARRRADRPHHRHPRLGRARRDRAGARRRAGRAGDLRVPAAACARP